MTPLSDFLNIDSQFKILSSPKSVSNPGQLGELHEFYLWATPSSKGGMNLCAEQFWSKWLEK